MRRLVVITLFVITLFAAAGCTFTGPDGEYDLQKDSEGYYLTLSGQTQEFTQEEVQTTVNRTLNAQVKGSIYEGGETVSVFGTCLTKDYEPYPNVSATISAWYPNGSVLFTDTSMQVVQPGYFLYTAPMDVVQGTYLTQMECTVAGSNETARVFGEWQNPAWVQRIQDTQQTVGDINNTVNQLNQTANNLTIQIGNLSYQVEEGFNITWDRLESVNATILQELNITRQNLTTEIRRAADIANASVDRQDSYLAQLLQNITSFGNFQNQTGQSVTFTEDAGPVVYWDTWDIRVDVTDPQTGSRLTYPDVLCDIYTSQSNTTTAMSPEGNHFEYEEFINTETNFTWNVSCVWA